jgi:CubicO group peptidase (beta-lactamase class C family)
MFDLQERARMDAVWQELRASRLSGAVAVCDGSGDAIVRIFGCIDSATGNKITESTLFDLCSVTKSFTAAAVLQLEAENRLSLEGCVGEFAHGLPAEVARIRIRHLLNHSSGLADFLDPAGQPREYSLDADYSPWSSEQFWEQIRRTTLRFPSGERWSYSNTGYTLLAAIVERITGEGFEEYLRRALLWPWGMHDTGYVFPRSERARVACGYIGSEEWSRPVNQTEQPSWNLIGNGGLYSTISDLLLWKTAFCAMQSPTMRPDLPNRRILVDQEMNIWSDFGAFARETDSEVGPFIYHNGSNSVFSATIRSFPRIDRYMAITSARSDASAMSIARTICDCWTPSQTSQP